MIKHWYGAETISQLIEKSIDKKKKTMVKFDIWLSILSPKKTFSGEYFSNTSYMDYFIFLCPTEINEVACVVSASPLWSVHQVKREQIILTTFVGQ